MKLKSLICLKAVILILTVFWVINSSADEAIYSTKAGAIKGYDPVAYFNQRKAVKGQKQWTANWNGANWYFSSAENLARFEQNPFQYAPQYGGYCAYGVSQGYLVSVDPKAWSVVNNKLYLNFSQGVKNDWLKSTEKYIALADKNWPNLIN